MSNKKIKRVILLGRKQGAADALAWLLKQGIQVPLVVAGESAPLEVEAKRARIPVLRNGEALYKLIAAKDKKVQDIDLVVSYLFAERMRRPLIALGERGCINLHPAPLPEYKSRAGYNTAILDGKKSFGVSAHLVDSEAFDAGPIIKVRRFRMDPARDTAWSLERKTQPELLELFKEVITLFKKGKPLRTKKNEGGLYLTSAQLEALKEVFPDTDTPEQISRKIRAFFFPPYHGAFIRIGGVKYSLVDETLLEELSGMLIR